jgi:hypothetical protein
VRAGFEAGWFIRVDNAVTDFGMTDEERAGAHQSHVAHYGGEIKGVTKENVNTKMDDHSLRQGYRAGKDFQLHRPVGEEALKIESH